jgi:hypothetical protein
MKPENQKHGFLAAMRRNYEEQTKQIDDIRFVGAYWPFHTHNL